MLRRTPKGGNSGRRESEELEPVAPLEVSSGSWVAQQRTWHEERQQQGAEASKQDTDAAITRQIRAVLNKLTLERFGPLLQQLISCGISTQEHLEILMHEIMEKATTQHHFIPMYTELCASMQEWCVQNQIGDSAKGSFKRILLNECQNSFERYLKPPEHLKDLKGEDRDEAEIKYKTAMLGNIRFVGALLQKNMVGSSAVVSITTELLSKPSVPQALECLAAFLTTVGGMFDQRPDWKYRDQLRKVFADVERLSRDAERVPARIRCLLSDVLDLRKAGWQDQKQATKSVDGPMTLDEVHSRAAEDHARMGGGAGRGGNHGQSRSSSSWASGGNTPAGAKSVRGGGASASSGAWTTVAASGRPRIGAVEQVATSNRPRTPAADQAHARPSPSSAAASDRPRSQASAAAWNGRGPAPRQAPEAAPVRDLGRIRAGLRATVKELCLSHDVAEALQRVREMRIPEEHQAAELARLLVNVVDEGGREARCICFRFAVRLLVEGVLAREALLPGLESFFGKSEDLALDTPSLPRILREECVPALEELVRTGFLSVEQYEAFARRAR